MEHISFLTAIRVIAISGLLSVAAMATAERQIVSLGNFDDGNVPFAEFPDPLPNNTWLRANSQNQTFAAPSGNGEMKLTDTDGVENGVYAIFTGVVPEAGEYTIRSTVDFHEEKSAFNAYSPYSNYLMGVTVNGAHRAGIQNIAAPNIFDDIPWNTYLTSANDTAKLPYTFSTDVFTASPSDTIQVIFTTWTDYERYSGAWNGSYILIDDIELVPHPEPTTPVSISGWELE